MERKKNLTKIAIAALIIASANPSSSQAAAAGEAQGTLIAASCGASSCGGKRAPIADNSYQNGDKDMSAWSNSNTSGQYPGRSTDKTTTPSTNRNNSGQSATTYENPPASTDSKRWNREEELTDNGPNRWVDPAQEQVRDINGGRFVNTNAAYNEAYYNSYNTNRSDSTSPTYLDNPRGTGYEHDRSPRGDNGLTNLNRQYNTVTDYDYNRASVNTITSSSTLTEAQLLGALNSQGRAIYLSLDPLGKSLAIQLASEDSYRDKNLAVREAQRRMNERQGLMINQ